MTTRIDGVLQSESIYEAVRCGKNTSAPDVPLPTLPAETLLAAIAATDTHSLHPLLMYATRQRNVLTKTGKVRSLTILLFPVNLKASLVRNVSARRVYRTSRKIKMQHSIMDGQILEFYGTSGDRLVLTSDPLSRRDFLMSRYAAGNGPYPQDGKPWSTMQCLCLGERKDDTERRGSYFTQKRLAEPQEVGVERCEMVFEEDGLILVEYPYRGHLHDAVIERIDKEGGTHTPDGMRKHWAEKV